MITFIVSNIVSYFNSNYGVETVFPFSVNTSTENVIVETPQVHKLLIPLGGVTDAKLLTDLCSILLPQENAPEVCRTNTVQRRTMPATAQKPKSQTTTVRLPRGLYERAQSVLKQGETGASSLNELLVDSLTEKLEQVNRRHIDEQFSDMRYDSQYHQESGVLADQFASNDAETLHFSEKERR